jgi:hypothetical protein
LPVRLVEWHPGRKHEKLDIRMALADVWNQAERERCLEKVRRGAFIQYADLARLMVMLNIKIGGGVMAVVDEGQGLVIPRPQAL